MKTINEALIIGGTSGMGLATAKRLIQRGISITITGRDEKKLSEAKNFLGDNANTIQVDLYKEDCLNSFIEKIKNNLSPIVDEQWIKLNPNHKTFLGQTLEHHHINNAGTAAYIPRDLHRGTVNKDIIHVDNMAIGLNDFKNIVKG